jgi:cytochrome c biogenesis protein CcmG/thiol:disulfide interchange protein DsbE
MTARPAALRAAVLLASIAGGALMPAPEVPLLARGAPVCDAKPARNARNFLLRDVDNRKWTFASTKGKVVLVDFWATWCGPCKVEIPQFVEMYGKYKGSGFEVVGIAMDTELEKIKSFAAEFKITYPILIGAGADGVMRAWDVAALPTTFIVGRDGSVCRRFVGQSGRDEVEAAIKSLL